MPDVQDAVPRSHAGRALLNRTYTDPYSSLVLGTAEIAILLDVQVGTVSQWKFRNLLPKPEYRLRCGDLWTRHSIERWARVTGRWVLEDGVAAELHMPEGWTPPA